MSTGQPTVALSRSGLRRRDVVAVARGGAAVSIGADALDAIEASARIVAGYAAAETPVYGISTGFGALATTVIPPERREELQRGLIRSHAAGMGPPVEDDVVRAMMLLRARTLAMGFSGVRPVVVETIVRLLNAGITPIVPEYGSLGCSGDLAPLAHVALVLMGVVTLSCESGTVLERGPEVRTQTVRMRTAGGGRATREETHRLGGRARDAQGDAAEGAWVVLEERGTYAVTDAEGRFRFDGLPAGTYRCRARGRDGSEASAAVTLPGAMLDLSLESRPRAAPKRRR